MNRVFGYVRVSTKEQNTDTQLDTLSSVGCDEIFQEKISGALTSRPELDRMLAKLRPGDTVVVAKFFRLGRSRDHLIDLVGRFKRDGITFRALDLGVDSRTPAGKFMLDIFAAMAEYDRESIRERTAHGRELARAKGTHMGRPTGVDAAKLEKIKTATAAGLSVADIVRLTGISETTVKRYRKHLKNVD